MEPMKPLLEAMIAAKELLSDPTNWTKNKMASKLKPGKEVGPMSSYRVKPNDPEAVCWCLTGAISKMEGNVDDFRDRFSSVLGYDPEQFNDQPERKHSEVIEALDLIIKYETNRIKTQEYYKIP